MTQPMSPKAYLSAVITRVSIDVLRSARVRREEYVGEWFPEPLLEDPHTDPERSAEFAQIGVAIESQEINGQAGAVLRDRRGWVLSAVVLDVIGVRSRPSAR